MLKWIRNLFGRKQTAPPAPPLSMDLQELNNRLHAVRMQALAGRPSRPTPLGGPRIEGREIAPGVSVGRRPQPPSRSPAPWPSAKLREAAPTPSSPPAFEDTMPFAGGFLGHPPGHHSYWSEPPAPTPAPFTSGYGGDFAGAGAVGSWDEPPAPPPASCSASDYAAAPPPSDP